MFARLLVSLRREEERVGVVRVGEPFDFGGDCRGLAFQREQLRGMEDGVARAERVRIVARELFERGARLRAAARFFERVGPQAKGVVADLRVLREVVGDEERGRGGVVARVVARACAREVRERAGARAREVGGELRDDRFGGQCAAVRKHAQALVGRWLVGARLTSAATRDGERERGGREQRRRERDAKAGASVPKSGYVVAHCSSFDDAGRAHGSQVARAGFWG